MNIKKWVKISFLIIIALIVITVLISNISMMKIKENNISKNKITNIISIQENMNRLILDAILIKDLEKLKQIKNSFNLEEKKFEDIKDNFFIDDKDDFLDKLILDLHHHEKIKKDLKILFSNEKTIENAFEEVVSLQEETILLSEKFENLYPEENNLRKVLQSFIWNTKDVSTIKNFSDLKYLSKEALYQHKDKETLDKWIEKAEYLKEHTKKVEYEDYLKIANKLKEYVLATNYIEKKEKELTESIQNILDLNNTLNANIELNSENILNYFINRINTIIVIISLILIIVIILLEYKVNKNVGLSVDEIEKRVADGLQEINSLNIEIEDTQREVVFTMGSIGESRNKETGNHVKRVAEYSKLLALYYGLKESEAEMIKQASPMHDIGKVAIPDAVLNKPGRFDEAERKIMDTHAQLGYDMLKYSNRELLKCAATVAYEHHEKWDGTGYPRQLKGEDIHIYGRITALADVFDALGSDRCYKKAWDDERIFNLFKEERAKHFDPKVVDIFFEHLDEFLKIRDKFKDV